MPIAICSFASSRRLRASLRLTAGYTPRERSFSFPPKRCLSRHHLPPLEVTSRKRPPPSNSLAGLSCGLAERIAVSVNAMGVTSFGGSRVTPRVTPAGGRYLYAFLFNSGQTKRPKSLFFNGFWPFLVFVRPSNGGGGGNRTPVREYSTRSIYRLRPGLNLAALVAPDQAQRGKPAGDSLTENPGERRFPPA